MRRLLLGLAAVAGSETCCDVTLSELCVTADQPDSGSATAYSYDCSSGSLTLITTKSRRLWNERADALLMYTDLPPSAPWSASVQLRIGIGTSGSRMSGGGLTAYAGPDNSDVAFCEETGRLDLTQRRLLLLAQPCPCLLARP